MDKWESEKTRTRIHIESHKDIGRHTFKLKDDTPYKGVAWIGCQHIGNDGTDYDAMERDARLVAETNGAYAFLGGDAMDNFILTKIAVAMMQSKTSPDEQWEMVEYYLSLFNGDILGMVSGNHEAWTKKTTGCDMLKMIGKKSGIRYAPNTFVFNLENENVNYKCKVRHKYRFNSSLNLLHTVKRMYDMGDDTFDIGAVFHHHENEIGSFWRHGVERIGIRGGSYKILDRFSDEVGFNGGRPVMPMTLVNTKEREIILCMSVEQGCKILKSLNEKS